MKQNQNLSEPPNRTVDNPRNPVSQHLRAALQKRAERSEKYRIRMKIGCSEPPAPEKMAAAILKARKQNKKKK